MDEIENISDLVRMFKALGHGERIRILRMLSLEPSWAYKIHKILNISPRMVTKHLNALEDAGLIKSDIEDNDIGPPRKYFRPHETISLSMTFMPGIFDIGVTCPAKVNESIREDISLILSDIKTNVSELYDIEASRKKHLCDINGFIKELNKLMLSKNIPRRVMTRVNRMITNAIRTGNIDVIDKEFKSIFNM